MSPETKSSSPQADFRFSIPYPGVETAEAVLALPKILKLAQPHIATTIMKEAGEELTPSDQGHELESLLMFINPNRRWNLESSETYFLALQQALLDRLRSHPPYINVTATRMRMKNKDGTLEPTLSYQRIFFMPLNYSHLKPLVAAGYCSITKQEDVIQSPLTLLPFSVLQLYKDNAYKEEEYYRLGNINIATSTLAAINRFFIKRR